MLYLKKFDGEYGAEQCEALKASIETKELTMLGEEAIIPNKKSKVLIHYKNIDKVGLRKKKKDY